MTRPHHHRVSASSAVLLWHCQDDTVVSTPQLGGSPAHLQVGVHPGVCVLTPQEAKVARALPMSLTPAASICPSAGGPVPVATWCHSALKAGGG